VAVKGKALERQGVQTLVSLDSSYLDAFVGEEPNFEVQPAAIPGRRPVGAEQAVAGDHQRDAVRASEP
jgi:hypothetical protein